MQNLIKKGIEYFQKKEHQKSLEVFTNILRIDKNQLQALNFVALNYIYLGQFKDSILILEKIINLNPNIPEVYFNKGLCHFNLAEYEIAIKNYEEAIKIKPDYHQAYINLGDLNKKLNRLDDAVKIYEQACKKLSNLEDVYINLSEVYKIKKNFDETIKYCLKALELNEKNYLALNNLATAFIDTGKQEEAIKYLEKALKINPNFRTTYLNLGIAYRYDGQHEKAKQTYNAAIVLDKNFHDAYFNLGQIQLGENDFHNGWINFEHRWGKTEKRPIKINFSKPQWNETFDFQRILIWGEQGIGEQLLFSTIIPELLKKFQKVYLLIDDRLCQIFKENYPDLNVYKKSDGISEDLFDYHLPIGSLGMYFRKNINEFNNQKNFKFKNKISSSLKSNGKYRCALSWKSINPDTGYSKSIKLESLINILNLKEIDFYDIQYTNEDIEIKQLYKNYGVRINKIDSLDTFNDLYGLMNFINDCDFTISVSNSNAHMSAALGKPTFLLLPREVGKFWYWENDYNNRNLWYPSIIKFKQEEPQNWIKPVDELKQFIVDNYINS